MALAFLQACDDDESASEGDAGDVTFDVSFEPEPGDGADEAVDAPFPDGGGDGSEGDAPQDNGPSDPTPDAPPADAGDDGATSDTGEDVPADAVEEADAPPLDAVDTPDSDGEGDAADSSGDAPDAPESPNVMFLSSVEVTPSDLGGLEGADALCDALADDAGLPEGTYIAFLSTSTSDIRDRLAGSRGWVRPDGLPLADDVDSMFDQGRTFYPPMVTETLEVLRGEQVVTATNNAGAFHSGATDCDGFDEGTGNARFGWSENGVRRWIDAESNVDCDDELARIYCFQIGHNTPVSPANGAGRLAFVSDGGFDPASGLAGADEICGEDAVVSGTFLAFLGANGASAQDRFTSTGQDWVRPDGTVVAHGDELFTDHLLAPIAQSASGAYVEGRVWTGSTAPDEAGTLDNTCNNWADNTNGFSGRQGIVVATSADGTFGGLRFFAYDSRTCNTSPGFVRIYCLQEE